MSGGGKAATVLTKVETNLSADVEAFEDEDFASVPDWRLSQLHVPARADGCIALSGVCNPNERALSSVTVHVTRADKTAKLTYTIPTAPEEVKEEEVAVMDADAEASRRSLGRLLQVHYTLASIRQVSRIQSL